jgi:uncharacterized protein involved in exopolysaccharide biosynthesis
MRQEMDKGVKKTRIEEEDDWLDGLKLVLSYIAKNWKLVVSIFAITFILGGVYILCKMPVYQVTTSIMVKDLKKGGNILSEMFVFDEISTFDDVSTDNELDVISSLSLIKKVVAASQINLSYRGKSFFKSTDLYGNSPIVMVDSLFDYDKQLSSYIVELEVDEEGLVDLQVLSDDTVIFEAMKTTFPIEIITPEGPLELVCADFEKLKQFSEYEISIAPTASLAKLYQRNLIVQPMRRNSSILKLSLKTTSIERGTKFLNNLVELYNKSAMDEKNEVSKKTEEFIAQRLEMLSKELGATEKSLERYKKKEGLTDLSANAEMFFQQSAEYEHQRAENETQLNLVRYLKEYLMDDSKKGVVIPSNVGLSDQGLVTQINKYNEILLSRNRLMSSTSETNPVVSSLTTQMEALYDNIKLLLESVENGLQITQQDLRKQYDKYRGLVYNIPTQERMSIVIERQRHIQQELFVLLLRKREENALALAATVNKAKVVEECHASAVPVEPKAVLIFTLCFFFAGILSASLLFTKKARTKTIESVEEYERIEATQQPLLSVIPSLKNGGRKTEEAIRRLRANLFSLMQKEEKQEDGYVISFISYRSGEGSTHTVQSTAKAMAAIGKTTLMIGADFPESEERVALENINSLEKLSKAIRNTQDEGVALLPVDWDDTRWGDFISSDQFAQMVKELRKKYDFVMFDSRPIEETSDAFVLNKISDQTLYVFQIKKSLKKDLKEIDKCVEKGELNNISIVVNS